jgi:hypothetical protein
MLLVHIVETASISNIGILTACSQIWRCDERIKAKKLFVPQSACSRVDRDAATNEFIQEDAANEQDS